MTRPSSTFHCRTARRQNLAADRLDTAADARHAGTKRRGRSLRRRRRVAGKGRSRYQRGWQLLSPVSLDCRWTSVNQGWSLTTLTSYCATGWNTRTQTYIRDIPLKYNNTHTHTHTHTFNGPLSGTIRVSRYQKGKINLQFTEARDSEWQWHLLGHMQVCTAPRSRQITMPVPHHSVFYRPDALPVAQPTASKHWRH